MKQLMETDNYAKYIQKQWKEIDRTYELKLFSKHIDMIEKFVEQIGPESIEKLKVLCVGARYGIEMLAFEQMGFSKENIIGVDIYPRSNNILKADMHNLPFEKGFFDVVYSHHSIDHSLNPHNALSEMKRVSNKNSYWIFSIPFNDYGKEEAIDFDTADEIIQFVKEFGKEVFFQLQVTRNKDGFVEPNSTWLPVGWKNEIRLIVK